jgi:hypothetical protein
MEAPATAETAEAKAAEDTGEEENRLKAIFARSTAKITPAVVSWAKRVKVTAALLAARARGGTGEDAEIPMRRTTAPAPGGGLHTAGRKVVRGSVPDDQLEDAPPPVKRFAVTKRKAAIAGSIGIATVLAIIALRKPAPAPQLASAPQPEVVASMAPETTAAPATTAKPLTPPIDPLAAAATAMTSPKPGKVTPFTNGPVGAHPTLIRIKMDGAIDGIQGAPQPTGFTIVIPNRKSIEPTTSLAEKDGRIAAISVSNEPTGAELSVSFKDGVPNYLVRAHGDTLEMVLARSGAHGDKAEAHAKKKKGKKH